MTDGHALDLPDGLLAPCHWPGTDERDLRPCAIRYPGGQVVVGQIDPPVLGRAVDAIRRAQRALRDRPIRDIVRALDACAAAWCDPANEFRREALRYLVCTTGCDEGMLAAGLTATFQALREPHLSALIEHELGGLDALDDGLLHERSRLLAVGPNLTWVIGGGIVPNAVAAPVFAAMLAKSAVLVKTPSREPIFGGLLARSLARTDPHLGACVAAGWWAGGTGALDALAAERCDAAIVTGADATLEVVARRLRAGTRMVGYGDRVSLIAVGRDRLAGTFGDLLWMQIAEAVGWYDQHGCLSPHVVYIEQGGDLSPRQAAERLTDAMALYEAKAPRGPVSAEIEAALEARRQRVEVKAVDQEKAALWKSPARPSAWTVAFEADPVFVRSPGYRFVTVKPVYDLEDLPAILRKASERFQAVAIETDPARRQALGAEFSALHVSRICAVPELQRPPLSWPRDGKPVLGSLVRWVDVG